MSQFPTEEDKSNTIKAQKGLNIIFILLVVAANSILVIQILRKHIKNILLNTRCCIIILLALGDVFYVMFNLIVANIQLFEDFSAVECGTVKFGLVAQFYVWFVYPLGVALIVLEMYLKSRITQYREVFSIIFPMIPFGLGLVVIFPLHYVDFIELGCGYKLTQEELRDRTRAMFIVSLCVAPVIALATTFLNMFIKTENAQQESGDMVLHGQVQANMNTNVNMHYPNVTQFQPTKGQPSYNVQPIASSHVQYKPPTAHAQQEQVHFLQHPQHNQIPQYFQGQQPRSAPSSNEKFILLTVAISCFIFCMPLCVYTLAYTLNTDRTVMDWDVNISISLFVTYLTFLRPVVAPLLSLKLINN